MIDKNLVDKTDKTKSLPDSETGFGPPKPRVGVICEFTLYRDERGLGAENVVLRQVRQALE